jgi:hypothetical protein
MIVRVSNKWSVLSIMLYCNGLSIWHHGDSFVSVSLKFQKRSVSFLVPVSFLF